jgi:hypothetical protein
MAQGEPDRSNKVNIAESRIATYNWGAAYLIDNHLNVVVDKGSRMNKSELIATTQAHGVAIACLIKSLNQFGWRSYSYRVVKAVA